MLFDIKTHVLQYSVGEFIFSKTAVLLQLYERQTPSQLFYKKTLLTFDGYFWYF